MSKAPAPAPADGAAPPPKSKKLLIIVLALVLVLLLAVAAVGFLLLKSKHDAAGDDEEAVEEPVKAKKKAEPGKPPAFVALEPFTVNLAQEQGEQFLQVIMSLRIEDAHEQEPIIKGLMPKIRNDIVRVLRGKKASELATVEGTDHLAEELKNTVNAAIDPPKKGREPEGPVEEVVFTSFIIQ